MPNTVADLDRVLDALHVPHETEVRHHARKALNHAMIEVDALERGDVPDTFLLRVALLDLLKHSPALRMAYSALRGDMDQS